MINKKIASEIAIGVILLFAIVIGGIFWQQNQKMSEVDNKQPEQRACTMEAKLCNDGTYVSRTGPNCEFTPCPTNNNQQSANNNQEKPQVFTLKVGEKAIYKGEFNLEIKLVEIGKIGDLFSKGERTEKGKAYEEFSQMVGSIECPENDCTTHNLTNYYVLIIKHQKGNELGCGAKEEPIVISSKGSEIYECPDAYNFEVNPLNSNNERVEFEINYTPYSFGI